MLLAFVLSATAGCRVEIQTVEGVYDLCQRGAKYVLSDEHLVSSNEGCLAAAPQLSVKTNTIPVRVDLMRTLFFILIFFAPLLVL